jgi:voltage-gated potassium channel Kch
MPHPERSQLDDTAASVRFYTDQLLASQPEYTETRTVGALRFDSAVAVAGHGLLTHIHRIQGDESGQEYHKYSISCPSLEAISRKMGKLIKMYDLIIESNQLPSLNVHVVAKPHRLLNTGTQVTGAIATKVSMLRFLTALQQSELADHATIAKEAEREKNATPDALRKSVGNLYRGCVAAYIGKSTIRSAIQ